MVSVTGLLLALVGVGLLILELKTPHLGLLGISGTACLGAGVLMITRSIPGLDVGLGVIAPIVLALAGIVLVLARLGLEAQRVPPATGADAMVGERGRARTAITAAADGQVDVRGELWRASSREPIPPGHPIRVVAVNGLTLRVEPAPGSTSEGAPAWKP